MNELSVSTVSSGFTGSAYNSPLAAAMACPPTLPMDAALRPPKATNSVPAAVLRSSTRESNFSSDNGDTPVACPARSIPMPVVPSVSQARSLPPSRAPGNLPNTASLAAWNISVTRSSPISPNIPLKPMADFLPEGLSL